MPIGMLLDKFPIKKTILLLAVLSLVAQVGILLSFYFQFSGYKIIIYIFRGLFGITGEALFTIQSLLISLYAGIHYEVLMGVCMCGPMIFDSLNNVLTPLVFDGTNSMELAWGIGVCNCLVSLAASIVIAYLITQ
jgi:hypothetical protein